MAGPTPATPATPKPADPIARANAHGSVMTCDVYIYFDWLP